MPKILAVSSSLVSFHFITFSKTRVLLKIFDTEFPYKLSYFEPLCLPVKMAAKTGKRPIGTLTLWSSDITWQCFDNDIFMNMVVV